ncbi:MAG: pentapeptide repeat protein [Verrucomicrobiaceae bacterium]|nr:pentapeptide repeat protein [Verrucomicrobiaceae bacterium]
MALAELFFYAGTRAHTHTHNSALHTLKKEITVEVQQSLTKIDTRFGRLVKALRASSLLAFLDQLSRVSIVVVAVTYVLEAGDRRREGIYRAWQVINSVHDSQASGGRIEALEELVHSGVSLGYINLEGVNLRGAKLNGADFANARLGTADLSGAQLKGANFSGADLRQTNFVGANLSGANLKAWGWLNNNLSDADLTGALGITQERLDNACGTDKTKVPPGLRKPSLCGK